MTLLTKSIGILALIVLGGAIAMLLLGAWQFNPRKLDPTKTGGFAAPVMAMEFVETVEQARAILDQRDSQNRNAVRLQIYLDFGWIVSYWLLFLAVSYLLSCRNCPWANYLASVAGVSATGAAAFDVWENLGMLQVVNDVAMVQTKLAQLHIRDAALLKWTLVFVTLAVLAPTFYGLHQKLNWIGYFFTLTAFAGYTSLFYKPWLGVVVPLPLLIGLILLAWHSLRSPQLFCEAPC